jgi:outer membrane protein
VVGACVSTTAFAQAGVVTGGAVSQTSPQAAVTAQNQPLGFQINAVGVSDATGNLGLAQARGSLDVLSLDDVLRAVDDAPDLLIATERVAQAAAQVSRAWSAFLPSLSLSGGYTHTCQAGGDDILSCSDRTTTFANKDQLNQQATLFESVAEVVAVAADFSTSADDQERLRLQEKNLRDAATQIRNTSIAPVVVQPASVFFGQLSLSVPVFNPRAFPLLWNAESARSASSMAAKQAKALLKTQLARAYATACAAQLLADNAVSQRDSLVRHRDAVRARVEAKIVAELALKRAELDVLRAEQAMLQTQATRQSAVAAIGTAIGRTTEFATTMPVAALPTDVSNVDAAIVRALDVRPDLRLARSQRSLAEGQVNDVWAQFLPSVNIVGQARASSFTQGFVRDPINATLTIHAVLPLYDGGLRYAALADGRSRVREESVRIRQLEDRVAAQVRGNVREVAMRRQAFALAQQAEIIAQDAAGQAEAAFSAGVGTPLDVSDATLLAFQAHAEVVRADLDVRTAEAGLHFALGDIAD